MGTTNSSCWRGISDKKLKDYEEELIKLSGIPLDEFFRYNIEIANGDYLSTLEFGNVSILYAKT